jgi:hypothetical protein
MNKRVSEIANQLGFFGPNFLVSTHDLERFAEFIRADERKACAELVVRGTDEPVQTKTLEILRKERERIVDAIRARGGK